MTETTNLKDGIKPQGKDSSQGNINLSPKPNERKPERKSQAKPSLKPATKIDIDGTLTGKRVMLYVQTGNVASTIIGTIITMGSFWVVVKVEKAQLPFKHDIMYINKAYIIAYASPPDETKKGENQ
jgi:sRNA-binding regulator protein Hfq